MEARARLESWLVRRWYGPRPIRVLQPLSWLFSLLSVLRRLSYRMGLRHVHRSVLPVLVVGNLNVGGSGKTPLLLALIDGLRAHGWRPGVIARGHGGSERGPIRLPSDPEPARFGDEPCLVASRSGVPVAIGRSRAGAAQLLEASAEVDVLLADDGLQHYALARDVEILVIDGRRGLGNGALLPAGPLREPASRAAHCDFVVRNGGQGQPGEWAMRMGAGKPWRLAGGEVEELRVLADGRVHAVAGIGEPARFFDTLRALGLDPIEHVFPDHHPFAASDFDFGDERAVLMTEKDAVKCRAFAQPNWYALPIDARLPVGFFDAVDARLREHARRLKSMQGNP
jgi:tetraacyldisaccharide 4'-kinase